MRRRGVTVEVLRRQTDEALDALLGTLNAV
jgi:hypothetical protein